MRITNDFDKEYKLQIDPSYLELMKDVFDSVGRVIDGKRC
jgi:hypothetical protein